MSNARYGRPDDYVTSLKDEYEALGVDDLNEAADEVIHPQSLTWMIVGDLEKIEQEIREMDLGEVKVITAQ